MINDLEMEQMYSHIYPADLCAQERLAGVNRWLIDNVTAFTLPDDFDMSPVNPDGKFSKRVASLYYKSTGIAFGTYNTERVGAIYEMSSPGEGLYHFDFTRKLEWKGGDFGDSGSCFMAGDYKTASIIALENADCIAIRFWRDKNKVELSRQPTPKMRGYARAWCIPTEERVIIFNAYSLELARIAKILASWSDLPLQPEEVPFAPNGHGYDLYINGDVCRVLGEPYKDTLKFKFSASSVSKREA